MALPDLGIPQVPMSSEARRGWLRTNIPLETWRSVSGAQILRTLREHGMGVREQDFYRIRRDVLGLERYEEQIARLSPGSLVPKAWMLEQPDISLTSQAQYRFRVKVTNLETGEEEIITRAIADNRHLTRSEAEDIIGSLYVAPSAASNYRVEEITLMEVWTRPGKRLIR